MGDTDTDREKETKKKNVLVAIPIFEGHEEHLDGFVQHHGVDQDCDIMMVDNTVRIDGATVRDDYDFYMRVQRKIKAGVGGWKRVVRLVKHTWSPKETWLSYMLGDCWNRTIEYALDNDYDYWLFTAADIKCDLTRGSTSALIDTLETRDDVDVVGYPTNIYAKFGTEGPPAVTRDGAMHWNELKGIFEPSFYSWDELAWEAHCYGNSLMPVHGCTGYALLPRYVIEKCRFRYPSNNRWTWDSNLFYANDVVDENGFAWWCETGGRAINRTKNLPYCNRLKDIYKDVWRRDEESGIGVMNEMLKRVNEEKRRERAAAPV